MMMPHNRLSLRNQQGDGNSIWKFTPVSAFLVLLAWLLPIAEPVFGQGTSPTNPRSPVETAAKMNLSRPAAGAWGANGPENTQPTQPRVVFEDGQLSISANDSRLSDVLYALRACTGADIDIPPGAAAEHVTAQLGPGPARKVLADLLGWSSFDYVIQAGENDPLSIQSVTLMVRIKSTTPATPGAIGSSLPAVQPAAIPARQVAVPAVPPPPTAAEAPEADNRPDAAVNPSTDSPVAVAPQGSPSKAAAAPDPGAGAGMGSGSGKSPADMIQELQQMYQQRRTIQEQQNRALAAPTSQ